MYRKYYLVEVVLLLLLSHSGWNGPSVTLLSCTSEASKLVRDVVQSRFLSVVDRYRVSLPLECPLHPRRDMFGWLQTELIAGEDSFHCLVCGQKFRCENTFATHWDASHSRSLGMPEETVCLDDYCDVFRCDVLRLRNLKKQLAEEEELRKHQHRSSIRFSQEDDKSIRQQRTCDPNVMQRIHYKCRSLVRQCTIGMLANLSSKDFQDIEDDLDEALCSFLTCERYWNDFDSQIHHVPMLVIAIFGLIIIGFSSFCYYGTWLLLEKHPVTSRICSKCQKNAATDMCNQQKKQKHKHRKNSPEDRNTKSSEYPSKLGPQFHYTQNPVEIIYGRSTPEDHLSLVDSFPENISGCDSKEKILDYNSKTNSAEYSSQNNLHDYNYPHDLFDYGYRQKAYDFKCRTTNSTYNCRESFEPHFPHSPKPKTNKNMQYLTPQRAFKTD